MPRKQNKVLVLDEMPEGDDSTVAQLPPLMNSVDAAQKLGVSVRTLDRLKAAGLIAHVRIGAGPKARVFYRQDQLDDFMLRAERPADALPKRRRVTA